MSSMAFGGGLAGVARVSFEAETGEFNADTQRAERVYRDATRGMSDDAIRLELAQSKLHRELAKGPGNYDRIAKAELEVRRSEAALRVENERLERSFRDTGRTLDRATRRAQSGSRHYRGLATSVGVAAASFLGAGGLVYGLKSAIDVASNLEEQQNATRVVFKESADTVLDWSKTTVTAFGIARDRALEYAGSIGGIANASGLSRKESAELSKSIVELAADLASAKNADPSDMLERLRSGLVGEAEPLRRYGVLLSAAAVEQEAVRLGLAKVGDELTEGEKVQARYSIILKQTADIQGDYANTSDSLANSQRTLSGLWREAQGLVGQALAPAYTDAVQGLRDWLSEEKNQEELQRRINSLVKDGETVVRGFAEGLGIAKDAVDPLVHAMGGLENTIKALTLLWLAHKAKAILGFAGTAAASRTTSARMIADATAAGRAWDFATRPRTMLVTTTGTGTGVPTTTTPGRGRPRFPGTAGTRGAGLVGAAGIIAAGVVIGEAMSPPSVREQQRRVADMSRVDKSRALELAEEFSREFGTPIAQLTFNNPLLAKYGVRLGPGMRTAPGLISRPDEGTRARPDASTAGAPDRPAAGVASGGRGRPRRSMLDIALDLDKALTTPGTDDDKRIYREQIARYQAQVDALERRKTLTDKQKETLRRLYGDLGAAQSALDSIEDAEEAKIREGREKAAAKRKEQREKAAAREAKIEEGVARMAAANAKRINAAIDTSEKAWRQGTLTPKRGEQTFTLAQVQAMQVRFLEDMRSMLDRFGGNLAPDPGMGQLGTHAVVQTDLLREQNQLIKRLASTASHPGARYASTEMAASFGTVGF